MGCGDRSEGQEPVKGIRGLVTGDTKFQEAGCICDGCYISSSKPRAWHTMRAQDIFVN